MPIYKKLLPCIGSLCLFSLAYAYIPPPPEFVNCCNNYSYNDFYAGIEVGGPWKGRRWDIPGRTRVVNGITLEKGRSTAIEWITLAGHNRNIIMDFKDTGLTGRTEVILGFLLEEHKSSILIIRGWDASSMDFFLKDNHNKHLPKNAWRIYFEDSNGNLVNSSAEYHHNLYAFKMRPARDLWVPVPEPTTYGAAFSTLGLGLAFCCRRRRAASALAELTPGGERN